ncbi:MAG TPA: hypothetical protein EYP39_07295, partial [Ghiorsea sp.]|nr:hypothetical protein [Ghiorsea sp.]
MAVIYDAIMLSGASPSAGDVLVTANGDMTSIVEPMNFTLTNPGTLGVGDTTVIGGVTYTITVADIAIIDYTHDNGAGGTTVDTVKTFSFTMTEPGGGTISFLVP